MKLSMRSSLSILNFLIIGAIFVPPDFSSSVSRLTINWLVRLFVAVGFFLASLLLSHAVKSGQAERLEVIERFVPDADLDFKEEAEEALELPRLENHGQACGRPAI